MKKHLKACRGGSNALDFGKRVRMQIHINRNGQQFGPYSTEELQAYLQQGTIAVTDWAWHEGLANWVQISQLNLGAAVAQPVIQSEPQVTAIQQPAPVVQKPATSPVGGSGSGVSAESAMERLRKLQRGNMPAAKSGPGRRAEKAGKGSPGKAQPAEEFDVPEPKPAMGKTIAMVILGVCVAGGIGFAAMKFFGSDNAPPKKKVPEAVNQEAVAKLQKIGAHVTRDQDNQISGIQFPSINITTNGWKLLAQLSNVKKLEMVGCEIDDTGAVNLRYLAHLQRLNLSENPITDKSVEVLKSLTQLTALNLTKTKVTKNGVATIEAALPNCVIER